MILLDTHVLVWFVSNPELLSKYVLKTIESSMNSGSVFISSMSIWEIALLVKHQRIVLEMALDTWIGKVEDLPFISFVPVDNKIAYRSVHLQEPFHKDPADRIIVATALEIGAAVISKDEKIRSYNAVKTIW
jgi:PIN domain nuclease of toxin-antitoxin system